MPPPADADRTLPSVVATLPASYGEPQLVLTVIFHPHTRRIGESVPLPPLAPGDPPWILGRLCPDFGTSPGSPLAERHVSRQALAFYREGKELVVERLRASSRARVAGRELQHKTGFDDAALQAGVPIMLGHSVVLLLRLALYRGSGGAPRPASSQIGGDELLGSSSYMAELRDQLARAAGAELDVLILGATGTGKELAASAIHHLSPRAAAPMVRVNMTAIPTGLAAATLFGSARGSFTGSHRASEGYFMQAEGGSLFLDEIGDTPPELQPQLLRALQQREIQLVGGPIRRADVRVISATDADLDASDSGFRAALRHRLGACEIHLLPLREHPEDIGELLLHFLGIAASGRGGACSLPGPESGARQIAAWAEIFHKFLCYCWPGNVRELANFASQLAVSCESAPVLPANVSAALRHETGMRVAHTGSGAGPACRSIHDIDEAEFAAALQQNSFEVAPVARALGVSRQAVYRRIESSPAYRLADQVPQQELDDTLRSQRGDIRSAALALGVSASALRARLRASRKRALGS